MMPLSGKRIAVYSLGCRTNQYEGEALASEFHRLGATLVDSSPFDVGVVVSCTVTAQADSKSRKLVRRLRRENPEALLVLCGCYAQRMEDHEARKLGVNVLFGNRNKSLIPETVARLLEEIPHFGDFRTTLFPEKWDEQVLFSPTYHTRAFLKIQEGCDRFCSYCIIPQVRGGPVSRPSSKILQEARQLVDSGCSEIVLTGVHLGLYGVDTGESLGKLVQQIGALSGLKRIRFGSLEPDAVTEELLSALKETPSFCPHLHLPLQSGDDNILALMRRRYTTLDYARSVQAARNALGEDLHVSTDLMVGFPKETESAFSRSLDFVRSLALGKVHVFPYSPRPGTLASTFSPQLSRKEIEERMRRALLLGETLLQNYASQWVNKSLSILVEESKNGVVSGLSPHFVRVFAKKKARKGDECQVQASRCCKGVLFE